MLGVLLFAVFLGDQAANSVTAQPQPATLSVCDVLADDPTKLNGKVVRLRGLLGETDEGTWIIGECNTHLVTKGLAWGNDISVYVNAFDDVVLHSWEKLHGQLKKLGADPGRDRVWVTITGRIQTRGSMDDEVVKMPYGMARAGFGHMGGSPAEIAVMSIDSLAVESRTRVRPPP